MRRCVFERTAKGYSQARLAKIAGISQSTISLIESGRLAPTAREREALANALGVSPDALCRDVSIVDDHGEHIAHAV